MVLADMEFSTKKMNSLQKPIFVLLQVAVFLLIITLPISSLSSNAQPSEETDMYTPGRLIYAIHDWKEVGQNPTSFTFSMKLNCPKHQVTEYYWGHQFVFNNGNIGWVGATSSCMGVGGNGFIFTICDGKFAEPHYTGYISKAIEPGNGLSCVVPFEWKNGVIYTFHVYNSLNSSVNEWHAEVTESISNETIEIGFIEVEENWKTFYPWSAYFVEYFGPIGGCNVMPRGTVLFEPLLLNEEKALSYEDFWKTESCPSKTEVKKEKESLFIKTGSKY